MLLTFLSSRIPLTKTYKKAVNGKIEKTSYPFVSDFTSHTEDVKTLKQLSVVLTKHSALNHCLLKGNTKSPLINQSRAGSTDPNAHTQLLVFDIDGLNAKHTVEDFMKSLGLDKVSYIAQYSASYLIESKQLRAHVYVWLSSLISAQLLKQYLIGLNHNVEMLKSEIELTKTGMALKWPLDITACQNDKLLYIAPPVLVGLNDPMKNKNRIQYISKAHDEITLPLVPSTATNKESTAKKVDELREAAKLPKRKTAFKQVGSFEVLVKPDNCIITEIKQDRGFVYFNLNGGDSWGYYHPENNPDYIHNFKGEPVYLTKELLPEYWQQITEDGVKQSNSDGITYLAICDRSTGSYWKIEYNATTDELVTYPGKNETQIRHFAKQHGLPLGDFIPEWDLTFDPMSKVRIDYTNKIINTFQPSRYMKANTGKRPAVCPKTIYQVIHHALGSDADITDYYLNWLAYLMQFRTRTLTGWVMHGVPGTGKGMLYKHVLRELLGPRQATMRRMEEFNEPYNHYMKDCLLVVVDEVQTSSLRSEEGVMAKLRNFMTESPVQVRAMYAGAMEYTNFTNWHFFSNKADPIQIPKNDRRMNVGKYQPNMLVMTDKQILEDIPNELQAFHDYLMARTVNKWNAQHPMDTADRRLLMSISETSIDAVASAVLEGDFEFFIDHLPTNQRSSSLTQSTQQEDYLACLVQLLKRSDTVDGSCSIGREELRIIFEYTVGDMPSSPNKFTARLKHHRIHIGKIWLKDRTVNGIKIAWKHPKDFHKYDNMLKVGPTKAPDLKVVPKH